MRPNGSSSIEQFGRDTCCSLCTSLCQECLCYIGFQKQNHKVRDFYHSVFHNGMWAAWGGGLLLIKNNPDQHVSRRGGVNQSFSQADKKNKKKKPPKLLWQPLIYLGSPPMCSFLKMAALQSVFNLFNNTASAPTPPPGSCHHLQQQYQNSLYT